jgi:hypothetical protein
VATTADLPVSGEAVGESYFVGNHHQPLLAVWTGTQWKVDYGTDDLGENPTTSDIAAIDAETINRTLLQTGFQPIPKR